jgi:hypothetical protein
MQEEMEKSKRAFFMRGGFPGVIGCVDGTHVWIQAPTQNEPNYVIMKVGILQSGHVSHLCNLRNGEPLPYM